MLDDSNDLPLRLVLLQCGFFRRRQKHNVGFYTAKKVKQRPLNYYDVD